MPLWALPLAVVLLGVALAFGHFSVGVGALLAAATLLAIVYIGLRGRIGAGARRPVASLPVLLPGHLVLLFGLGTLDRPDALGLVWLALPIVSVAYDAASRCPRFRGQRVILSLIHI